MSTRDVSAILRANSLNGNAQAFATGTFAVVRNHTGFWDQVRIWLVSEGRTYGPTPFVRECWQRMRRMKATFERGQRRSRMA